MKVTFSDVVQISLSSAEDSANYFTGQQTRLQEPDLTKVMPSGVYRVVDDQLFQIVDGGGRAKPTAMTKV